MREILNKIKELFSKYDEIISIEEYGENEVIDIEVSGDHLFYVNGLLTHNSGSGGGYAGADIDMSNVSESSGITATADALMALFQLECERDLCRINLKILKNRLGGYLDKVIPFKVNYETLRMTDWNENSDDGEDAVFDNFQDASEEMFKGSETINKNEIKENKIEDL